MKSSFIACVVSLLATVRAADSTDAALLTALASDLKAHPKDYINFLGTASNIPPGITSLAREIGTYKDTSYTTLLDNSNLNVGSFESFALQLPWYSRLASEAGIPDSTGAASQAPASTGSTTLSTQTTQSSSSTTGQTSSNTSKNTKTTTSKAKTTSSVSGLVIVTTTIDSTDSRVSTSKGSGSDSTGSTSAGAGSSLIAPGGVLFGALAVVLL